MAEGKIICSKCQRERPEKEFFKMQKFGGQRCDICKDCMTANIDNNDPSTFLWILKKFDVPFDQQHWTQRCNEIYYKKGAAKFGSGSVIGVYLRDMNMAQWKKYSFADSDKLNLAVKERERRLKLAQMVEDGDIDSVEEGHDNGEIDDFDYEHMTLSIDANEKNGFGDDLVMNRMKGVDEAEISASFTDEDRMYLIRKWGPYYQPSEWLKMEEMYREYEQEYELNIDRRETLKKICRTSIQMDKAIDAGDANAARSYSTMMNDLRKSAKFTDAQNKEEKVRYLDSVGELVKLAEREGGIIPQLVDPDDYPQDSIDYTLKDLKTYTRNLVTGELGLGDLIESYVTKMEKMEEEKEKEREAQKKSEGSDPDEEDYLTDEEAEDWADFVQSQIKKDELLMEKEE